MVTAAIGAEKFYTSENNEARYEGLEEARDLDKKLVNAWVGHPNFTIVENATGGFETKIQGCIDAVFKVIGLPTPTDYHKKFLLALPPG